MSVPYGGQSEWPVCPHCARDIEYSDCFNCGGEGGRDLHEEDPLYYAPGDWEDCQECDGNGTLIWCPECGRITFSTPRPVLVVMDSKGRV